MKITLLKATFVDGNFVDAGEDCEVSEQDGNYLINGKKATLVDEKQKAKTKNE